jgi:TRAP-type C4-dicarboxylate transport system permease small subunit
MHSSTSDHGGFERELAATDRPLRDLALWLGILGPPLLWLTQFEIVYAFVVPVCVAHHKVVLAVVSVAFGAAIILFGWIGWNGRAPTAGSPPQIKVVRQFMAALSLMSMSLFLLVLIAQILATAMNSSCPI